MSFSRSYVVPWRNPEQFQNVYKCLYSPSITDKRWAVDQISVWESRCHPALPAAVDATVGLVRAAIQDLLYEMEKSLCQTKDIQMFYAMALVRFVNLTLEVDQSCKKVQLTTLAKQCNFPKWLIDLRHDAVHAFCPSLPVLRMGVQAALQHLEISFWKPEAHNIQPVVKIPTVDNSEIMELITRYRNIQHCRREKKGDSKELHRDLKAILKKLGGFFEDTKYREKVIDALLEPGVFLNTDDLIKILQASASVYMELEDDMSLPPELEWFWLPMVRLIHRYDLIHQFLEKLLLSQENCTIPICQKIAAAWAMRLFLATSSYSTNRTLDRYFKEKGVLFFLTRLLYACMKGLTRYLLNFLDMLTHRLESREEYRDLFCIAALRQGFFVEKDDSDSRLVLTKTSTKRSADTAVSEIIFTLGDVEDDLNELRRKRSRRDDNIWSYAPVTLDMSNVPLGAVLHPASKVVETVNEEPQPEVPEVPPKEERFILLNENDNEEITLEETDTPDNWLKTFEPKQFEMVYRRRQKN